MTGIELRIDRLVLSGLPAEFVPGFAEAVTRHLSLVAAGEGHAAGHGTLPPPEALARQVARQVWQAIRTELEQ
jgi:hypothetical protein